jgi:hypothetical protein
LKSTSSFSGSYFGVWNPGYSGNKPDGTTGYMDTNVNMLNNLTQNSTHLAVYSRTDVDSLRSMAGVYNSGFNNSIMLYPRFTNFAYLNNFSSGGTNIVTSQTNSLGFRLLSRNITSSFDYYNNTAKSTLAIPSLAGVNGSIYIGANNNVGTGAVNLDTRENAFVTIGDGLTDYEAKALYWIVQKYQTTLGRQVY